MLISRALYILILLFNFACSSPTSYHRSKLPLNNEGKFNSSTTMGNLITTAIQEMGNVDIVLYPSALLIDETEAVLNLTANDTDKEALIDAIAPPLPDGDEDFMVVGMMKGSHIKKFVLERSQEIFGLDLQTAGLEYAIEFAGGVNVFYAVSLPNGVSLKPDKYYSIAINKGFYFSRTSLPGYRFRNGFNFIFSKIDRPVLSVKKSLGKYLRQITTLPALDSPRARVSKIVRGDKGYQTISQIQGSGFSSPLFGFKVRTEGVVTALGVSAYYPKGLRIIIQSLPSADDGNPLTSEGLALYFGHQSLKLNQHKIKIGDHIALSGLVYEEPKGGGLSLTALREIETLQILASGLSSNTVQLGLKSRPIPTGKPSHYRGQLNTKKYLNLSHPIDFWESLENMKIEIQDPRIVGFSGGKENLTDDRAKGHLILNITADGHAPTPHQSFAGGAEYDGNLDNYHSEIIHLEYNALSQGIDRNAIYNVGDIISGGLSGVLLFENNFFGDGGYQMVLPQVQKSLIKWYDENSLQNPLALAERLKRSINPEPWIKSDQRLSLSTYNIKNLSGAQAARIQSIGKNIREALDCPDLMALIEVQDFNGISFEGGSEAFTTLNKIIKAAQCGENTTYEIANIDPKLHQEGGQPGGNIRVSFLINIQKVDYFPAAAPTGPHESLRVQKNGRLSHNPGRIAPDAAAFKGTRKSLAIEFYFNQERFVVIANHFNSKLGDHGLFRSQQPPSFRSESKRIQMAREINHFTKQLIRLDPSVNIAILGDFNDHQNSNAMNTLKGKEVINLLTQDHLVDPRDRYTYNYQGQSQMIDHFFVNQNLANRNPRVKILHINTDFMGRYSDHDPVLVQFELP